MEKLKLVLTDFEGPIDLLLHLIRESKIDIYNIPIAQIAEQYIDYLNSMKVLELDIAGDYLVMAATLMSIKSRRLLPKSPVEDEDDDFENPEEELVSQILTYQAFKEAAAYFESKETDRRTFHDKDMSLPKDEIAQFLEPGTVVASDLSKAFSELLKRHKDSRIPSEIIEQETISIEDAKTSILDKLYTAGKSSFKSLLTFNSNIEEIVTNFMAILELISKQEIVVQQKSYNEDIYIELRN
ncbi:segregation and condensation protein A [Companilactobacillus metriopterae]|uniref:segregation and condensation protein A n=1 Tax=Companilactobacillus metriopterae TaxID=1909267 RepID=UPI00100A58E5|nr:segregation/condensation protein A [Companilactobacillus metriopterae]